MCSSKVLLWFLLFLAAGFCWEENTSSPSSELATTSRVNVTGSDVTDHPRFSMQEWESIFHNMWAAMQQLVRPGPDGDTILLIANATKLLDYFPAVSGSVHALNHLFGLPAEAAAGGIPRNLSHVVRLLVGQASSPADSGFSYSMLGFLLAIGHPGLSAAVHLQSNSASSVKIRFSMAALEESTGGMPRTSAALEEAALEENSTLTQPSHPSWDLPGMCYWMGAKAGDVLGALAFGFHTLHGLTETAAFQMPPRHSRHGTPSLPREPQPAWESVLGADDSAMINATSHNTSDSRFFSDCRVAINVLNSHALFSVNQTPDAALLNDPVRRAVEYRIPTGGRPDSGGEAELPWESKEHADWVKFASGIKDPQGIHAQARLAYQGHYKAKEAPNRTNGMELWKRSAADGNGQSAWALLLLHLRGDFKAWDTGSLQELAHTVLESDQTMPAQKAFVRHLQFRHGLGQPVDPVEAGAWLEKSAKLGEINALMMMEALHMWRQALRGGVHRARLNIVDYVLSGRDPNLTTPAERCWEAYKNVHALIMHEHPMLVMLHAWARRSFMLGDPAGALLLYSFLSDLGSPVAARNAADLWASVQSLQSFKPAVPCPAAEASGCQLFYLRRAAALGDTEAMHLVSAREHAQGHDEAAFRWVKRAAESGDLRGRFERALWLSVGVGDLEANVSAALEELTQMEREAPANLGVRVAVICGKIWFHAKEALDALGCELSTAKLLSAFAAVAVATFAVVIYSRR